MSAALLPENRYHAALAEKTADELLVAIRKDHQDADACRAELYRQGWTDVHIREATGR